MTEFTDGTAKGKTLSLVELEKRLEELTEKYNAIPEIEYGVKTGLTVDPNSGNSFVVNYAKKFKGTPLLFAKVCDGGDYWSWVTVSTSYNTVYLWNNASFTAKVGVQYLAIGERG